MVKKYDRTAAKKIGKVMREFKDGELASGGTGKPVRSRKQAIAIGLSDAQAPWRAPAGPRRAGA
jgi:Family of unknown function (DUF6496)